MAFYELPVALPDEIEQFAGLTEQYGQKKIGKKEYRAHRVPFGIYEQRKDETYMVRVRSTGGALTPAQLRKIAELSRDHGADYLHITTRQELQLHDIQLKQVHAIQRQLLVAGLSTRGGGGNTVRNITVSWDSGVSPAEPFDPTPYALALTERLIREPDSWTLPRKFKIAFSNTPADTAYAAFNDLGFVAETRQGVDGFRVYAAGGFGMNPQTGLLLHDFIPAADIYPVTTALKRVFDKYGNRKNRHTARLRYLRRSVGTDKFVELYTTERRALENAGLVRLEARTLPQNPVLPDRALSPETSPEFTLWKTRFVVSQKQAGCFTVVVPVPLGKLLVDQALALAGLMAPFGEDTLRLTTAQNLTLRHVPEAALHEIYRVIHKPSGLAARPRMLGNSIACTGADTCRLGITLPRGAMNAVYKKLERSGLALDPIPDFRLNISGCPNACGQHLLADLGFYGKVGRKGERMYPAYKAVAGARTDNGHARFAEPVAEVAARHLPDFAADVIKAYLESDRCFSSFGEFVENGGRAVIQGLETRYGAIPDFDDDKNCYFDWGAEELFSVASRGVGECSAGLFDLIDVDIENIRKLREQLNANTDPEKTGELHFQLVLSASRMLLITRGVEAATERDVFRHFSDLFIRTGLVDSRFQPVVDWAAERRTPALSENGPLVHALVETMERLYAGMDDSLRFPGEAVTAPVAAVLTVTPEAFKDLRGVACPMNFVKTKIELARLTAGQLLRVHLDSGAPIENVPRSVQAEGHEIIEQKPVENYWTLVIRKK